MTTNRTIAIRLGALALTVLIASGCTGDDSPDMTETPPNANTGVNHGLDAEPSAVVCPEVPFRQQRRYPFRPDGVDTPNLEAEITVHRLSRRGYCVDANDWAGAGSITAYRVQVEDDSFNYGETYGVTDPRGSDELLNFPFAFNAYGPCRSVIATITLTGRDGTEHTFTATGEAGPRCT